MIVPDRRGPGGNEKAGSSNRHNFLRRTASALVLAPLAILVAYLGGWIFAAACAATAMVVLWEWTGLMTRSDNAWRVLGLGLPALFAAAVFTQARTPAIAIALVAVGAFLAAMTMLAPPRRDRLANAPGWAAAGIVYAAIVAICPVMLRRDPQAGFAILLVLFATVWSTDIFAYLVGRSIGGPLLWPRLSPNKTWSGAIGGFLGGVAAGVAVAYASGGTRGAVAGALALALSLVAQGGDLFESAIKRRFGVKDTGHLIPGHGGVMDRLDGFLVAAFAAVLIGILRQGVAAPARGLLVW